MINPEKEICQYIGKTTWRELVDVSMEASYISKVNKLRNEIVELKDERNDLECQLNEAIGDHNRVLNTLHEWKKRSKHESIIKLISSKISNRYKSIRNKIYNHMISKLNDEGSK